MVKSIVLFFLVLIKVSFSIAEVAETSPLLQAETQPTQVVYSQVIRPNILQGNFQVGGGASYVDSRIQKTMSLNPKFSFFLMDYFSAGISSLYFYRESESGAKDTGLGFGPNLTYYISATDRIAPFGSIGLNFFRSSSSEQAEPFSSTEIEPVIGAQYFLTNALSFGVSLVSRIEIANSSGQTEPATNSLQGNFGYFF